MPSNPSPEAALRDAHGASTDERRTLVRRELQAAWICVGSREQVEVTRPGDRRPSAACETSNESDAAFCKKCGTALTANRDSKEPFVDASGRLLRPLAVTALTSDGPHGRVLLAFTSEVELRKRSAAAHPLWLRVQGIRDIVEQHSLTGVILNPGGPWMFLDKDDL
jgi:hypothetical protein